MDFLNQIKNIPIIDCAEKYGYTVQKVGNKYYTLKEHDSVRIDSEKNCFWRNSSFHIGCKGGAGSVIDFVMEFKNLDMKAAMKELADMFYINTKNKVETNNISIVTSVNKVISNNDIKSTQIELPAKADNIKLIKDYLCNKRAISENVFNYFVKHHMLYQEDKYNNCIFVSPNKDFACARGITDKRYVKDLNGCNYNKGFFFSIIPNKEKNLVVAESVIDIMSIITELEKRKLPLDSYSFLALSGVNKLNSIYTHLEENNIDSIILGFDNDQGGIKATNAVLKELKDKGYKGKLYNFTPPSTIKDEKIKDWNDYIKYSSKHILEKHEVAQVQVLKLNDNQRDIFMSDVLAKLKDEKNMKSFLNVQVNFSNQFSLKNKIRIWLKNPEATVLIDKDKIAPEDRKSKSKEISIYKPVILQETQQGEVFLYVKRTLNKILKNNEVKKAVCELPNTKLKFEMDTINHKMTIQNNNTEMQVKSEKEMQAYIKNYVVGKQVVGYQPVQMIDIADTRIVPKDKINISAEEILNRVALKLGILQRVQLEELKNSIINKIAGSSEVKKECLKFVLDKFLNQEKNQYEFKNICNGINSYSDLVNINTSINTLVANLKDAESKLIDKKKILESVNNKEQGQHYINKIHNEIIER